jgi:uncharacterized protein (DUF1800 family)
MRVRLNGLVFLLCILISSLTALAATMPSIAVSPGYTNVGVGGTLQYTATVTGLTNTAVTWEVNEIPGGNSTLGTITASGLYTAPATVPTASTLIVALGSDGKTMGVQYVNVETAGPPITAVSPNPARTGSYTITLTGVGFKSGAVVQAGGSNLGTTFVNSTTLTVGGYQSAATPVVFQVENPGTLFGAGFTVSFVAPQAISPTTASVKLGATQQFTSAGATSWTATAGTISSTGLYTGPATMPALTKVTVTATGAGGSASATVTLSSPTPQTISPKTESVSLGAMQQFTSAGATSWTATAGTISSTGLYTAPSSMPSSSTVTMTATGPNGSASATVTLIAPVQAISPKMASVLLGAMEQFTSAGATSFVATAGAISSTGLYTAPATMPVSGTVTVTATGPNGSASATVTLIAQQAISPTTASVMLGTTQQFASGGATTFTATAGTISSSGLYTAPATMPASSSVTVTATGAGGSASAIVTLLPLQTISPSSVSVDLGATQQFTSAGATSWTATYGTVSSTGLYTAPAALSPSSTDTVIATGPNGSAQAAVVLIPPTPAITGAGTGGQLPLGVFNTTITGNGFTSTAVASLNGVALGTTYTSPNSLTIVGFAGQSGPANLTVSNGSVTSPAFSVQVGVQNALVSPAAARRFLEQAAFGPTPSDAANVQTLGIQGWLMQQFNMAPVSSYDSTLNLSQGGMSAHFLTNAVSNPDQLRQRVGFALSQIWVTSLNTLIWNTNMVSLQDTLLNDSFGNYRQIMEDVTLSPAMGQYLNMANNAMGDPTTGAQANQNYARELMQLFTLGTNMLNSDGSVQLDVNNLPIPTYSQFTITEFSRVYTGWTYAPLPGNTPYWGEYINSGNMIPFASEHDSGSKQLLNGVTAPAGMTPQQDLDFALDNIFNHPNLAPFVSKLLIQHLVKSNPSPAYVSRVAAVFNNNGNNVRGDMQATVTAILLDPEARANDNGGNDQPTDGHLQEPALFMAGMVRAFGGQMNDQNYYSSDLASMGEDLFNSPSVFNYYSESYGVPGTLLSGGEFEIFSPNTSIVRANEVSSLFSQYSNPVQTYGPGTSVDLTPFLPLAANPSTLVSALDLTLTHGIMPAAMKTAITTAVASDPNGALHQVQTACYLILTSNYYNVWH